VSESFVSFQPFHEFSLWKKIKGKRVLISFELELTARCNNNCRHCYINLPSGDRAARERELSFEEIKEIVDEAASLGALGCLLTGGEPLLREDFLDIYLFLKKKGLLVSVFTNATLLREEHLKFFKKFPPKDVEVSVYGITEETYEQVTRKPGSFVKFKRGLNLLLESGVTVHLKAMALRSNLSELSDIGRFCREKAGGLFRFDPFLHLRYDRNQTRNRQIKSERLSPEEIANLELSDSERFQALKKGCDKLIISEFSDTTCNHLFLCGAGNQSFTLSCDGLFRLCSSLWHPDCVYDLRKGNLTDAWRHFVPRVREMRSDRTEFRERCLVCPLINLCLWCPAHAYLETGEIDAPVEYFCKVAHARVEALKRT
jgi:radical SAM protein with 4Fe4S-binding SPASM domain